MPSHSPKFERVQSNYEAGLWNRLMVYNAIGRWITLAEYVEITGDESALTE